MNKPKRRSAIRENGWSTRQRGALVKRAGGKTSNSKLQISGTHQIPNSKFHHPDKVQIPRSKRLPSASAGGAAAKAPSASSRRRPQNNGLKFRWVETVAEEDWHIYCLAIKALRREGVPFMLGGGFALATFTGRWRDTKDIDFYIHPRDRDRAAKALTEAGFKDYFETRAYDRKWIYRSTRSGVIVDIIW